MTGFGHLAVGGGTTGYIVAAGREPRGSASLAELGLSHEAEPRARSIRRWAEMLEGGYDLHYRSVPTSGNSSIRQARRARASRS
jgi:hypothetical protein